MDIPETRRNGEAAKFDQNIPSKDRVHFAVLFLSTAGR